VITAAYKSEMSMKRLIGVGEACPFAEGSKTRRRFRTMGWASWRKRTAKHRSRSDRERIHPEDSVLLSS
jgi:hypothetical protein